MEGVTIKPDGQGRLLVTFPYSEARVEQIRRLPDRRWLPELKAWSIPDTPEARAALAEIFAAPPKPTGEWIGVAPRKPEKDGDRKPHASRVPGKPLTTNPPHPLIKAVDDELVLRGMAYPQGAFGSGTRKPVLADHELGAAAYAIKAVRLSSPAAMATLVGERECQWQREHLPEAIRKLVLSDEERRNHKFWSVFT
jgi:hypothetical protein